MERLNINAKLRQVLHDVVNIFHLDSILLLLISIALFFLWTLFKFDLIPHLIVFVTSSQAAFWIYKNFSSKSSPNFSNKTVLITGGGSGIGRDLSIQLARRGAQIIILERHHQLMEETADIIQKEGGKVIYYPCDVSNKEMVYNTIRKLKEKGFPHIDLLVNNAGIVFGKTLLNLEDEEIQRTIDVNLMSNFWLVKAVLPEMIKRNSGHIVVVSSVAGVIGMSGLVDYSASKFGSYGFAECLRRECYGSNIDVTLVCPWVINTGMFSGVKELLLPNLDPNWVANNIIRAIANKEKVVMLPSIFHLAAVTRFLPTELVDWVAKMSGAMTATATLQGRGAEWNMKRLSTEESVARHL